MSFIPIAAIIVSLISLLISFASYRRSKIFQDYEYAPRLQIVNEEVVGGSPSLPDRPAICYKAEIENRGSKPVKIDSIYLDYGDRNDANKRMKCHIEGEIFISPGKSHLVSKEIAWKSVEEMKKRFNINQCHFFFRIVYHLANNEIQETSRALFGFDGVSTIINVQKGDCLT